MKKKGEFIGFAALVGCLFGMYTSYAYSQSCEADGSNGTWKVVCSGTDCYCGQNWLGVTPSTLGAGAFEAIDNDVKLIETVMCVGGTMGGTSCGWPGGAEYDACCTYYFGRKPELEWPPCLQAAEDYINNGSSLCNSEVCDAYWNGVGCGMCDGQGGMYNPRGYYAWDYLFMKQVTGRTISQWVCNTCETAYNAKISECGGAENIHTWDNNNCTGSCKPCIAEYSAKIIECGSAQNIVNWKDATCTGECLNPGQNLDKCQN